MKTENHKLVLVTHSFPGGTGEPFLNDEIEFLAAEFSEVSIFCFEKHSPVRKLPENVRMIPLPEVGLLDKRKKLGILRKYSGTFLALMQSAIAENGFSSFWKQRRFLLTLSLYLLDCAEFIRKSCPKEKNTRITAYSYWGDHKAALPAILRSQAWADCAITRAHAFEIYDQSGIYHFFRGFQYRHLDKIVSVSEDGKKFLETFFPSSTAKYDVARLGTRDQGQNPFPDAAPFRIVSCSSVQERKRILSIARVIGRLPFATEWTHFGAGPEFEALQSITRDFPAHIQVQLKGHVPNEEVLENYRSIPANVFVNFSTMEGIPFSIMEALSFGIPVIACSAGGTKEIINEETGVLLEESATEEDLLRAIREFPGSARDTLAFREGARNFWRAHFFAESNFPAFAKRLKSCFRNS